MTTKAHTLLPLPDPPERESEDMTSFRHLAKTGSVHYLIRHLDDPDTTIVEGERYIVREPGTLLRNGWSQTCSSPLTPTLKPTARITAMSYPDRASRPTS